MRKKITIGLLFGAAAGIIDVIPMIFQKLSLDADISAFVFWVVSGLFIAISSLKINSILKGIIISYLVLFPTAIIVGWKEPLSLIPMCVMSLILGGFLGFLIDKFGKEKE